MMKIIEIVEGKNLVEVKYKEFMENFVKKEVIIIMMEYRWSE